MTHLMWSHHSDWPTLSFAMGTREILLCIFVGQFIAVHSAIVAQDGMFPHYGFPGFFENPMPFPFERNFDFTPFDTIFSSWRTQTPNFHMLADLPPIMSVPKVEVFCDDSTLTLLVGKRSYGAILTAEEMQLGDGCYSSRELPNQFVFAYGLDECGTTRVVENGLEMFTNTLHLNLKKHSPTWWQSPSAVHISCIPKRSYDYPDFFVSTRHLQRGDNFNIKAMNPSWTSATVSNVYQRGQVINLQVSAKTRPEQQLFIQSCFVSASPDSQIRPKHAVIMNKGCTVPLGSPHAVAKFVVSNRADVVNVVLNTSYLISELYVHCSVLLSDQGVTYGSKSCNYNVIQSRWEDLSGVSEVCECCSSKCKGPSVKHLPEDSRAIISTGPLVIVDKGAEMIPNQISSVPVTNPMQSDGAVTEDTIISGTSVTQSNLSSPPLSVVVMSQDPVARLTLWLPGQVQDAEHGDIVSNDLPELQPSTTDQQSLLNTPTNNIEDQTLLSLTMVDGWVIPPLLEKAAIEEESHRKRWIRRAGKFGPGAPQDADISLPAEKTVNVQNQNDFSQMRKELGHRQVEGANDALPVIRSKLEFSKHMDGSQMVSYEEEVGRQQEGKGEMRRSGIKGKRPPAQRGLFSTFLDLLRRMDKAE